MGLRGPKKGTKYHERPRIRKGQGLSEDPVKAQKQTDALKEYNARRREAIARGEEPPKKKPWGALKHPKSGEVVEIATHKDLVLFARSKTKEVVEFLLEVLRTPGRSLRERMFAANILLERGWGKAPMLIKLAGDKQAEAEENARGAPQLTEMPRDQFSREVLRILQEAGEIRDEDLAPTAASAAEPVVVEPELARPKLAAPVLDRGNLTPPQPPPEPKREAPLVQAGHTMDYVQSLANMVENPYGVDIPPEFYPQCRRDLVRFAESFPEEAAKTNDALTVLDRRYGPVKNAS